MSTILLQLFSSFRSEWMFVAFLFEFVFDFYDPGSISVSLFRNFEEKYKVWFIS